jgi:hypothetical protein
MAEVRRMASTLQLLSSMGVTSYQFIHIDLYRYRSQFKPGGLAHGRALEKQSSRSISSCRMLLLWLTAFRLAPYAAADVLRSD